MPIVTIGAEKREYAFGTPFQEIVKDYQEGIENDILLVSADGKLKELHKTLKEDCELRLITAADRAGFLSYQRSALFLMLKAFYDIAGKDNVSKLTVCFSMGNGLYIEPEGALALTRELLDRVKTEMIRLVSLDLPILKRSENTCLLYTSGPGRL